MLVLKLDYNRLTNIRLEPMPLLQQASFSNNMIKTTEGIAHPNLQILNLNGMSEIFLNLFKNFLSLIRYK